MELQIYKKPESGLIEWNYEELKALVAEKAQEYASVVYTEDQTKDAKADRAQLNKFLQALEKERKVIKKDCMKPYEDFEGKMKEITGLVKDAISTIDDQVKGFEEEKKAKKREAIQKYFDEHIGNSEELEWLSLDKIMDQKWLNASVSLSKALAELDESLEAISVALATLSNLPEFGFVAVDTYKKTLDMPRAIEEAQKLSQVYKAKEEHDKKKAQQDAEKPTEEIPGQIAFTDTESFDQYVESIHQWEEREWISFRANMTVSDATALKAFFDARGIEYRAI